MSYVIKVSVNNNQQNKNQHYKIGLNRYLSEDLDIRCLCMKRSAYYSSLNR